MTIESKQEMPRGGKRVVLVCQGTGCTSTRSEQIRAGLETEVKKAGLSDVMVDFTGCHGFCQQGPIVIVEPDNIFYTHVKLEDVSDIVHSHLQHGKHVDRLFYRDPLTNEAVPTYGAITF